MVAVFLAIAQAFIDGGFGTALIQKPDAVALDICSVFYFNIFIGFFSAAAFWLMAPLISAFYGQPELTPLARVLSPLIFINSFGLIQETTLSKHISFKTITQASLIGSVISGTGAVILAWTGFGIWSLIFQLLSNSVLKVLLLWILSSWRPTSIFSITSLRKMFAYASKMFVSSLLGHIFGNCYSLIIGRLFSANDLAFFTRAKTVGELPTETISGIVGRVIFPIFSKIQNDRVKLKIVMRKSLVFMVMLNFPVMTLLAVMAKPLVLLLLTDKWADSIPYLQLFCFVGLIYPLHLINLNVLQAMGRSDLYSAA